MRTIVQIILFFLLLVAVFMVLNRKEEAISIVPTPAASITPLPSLTPAPLPTLTPPPPVVVEAPVVIMDGGIFNDSFFTATVCANVPVFSQPAPNFNIIIGNLLKGNRVDVTGQSQFWARISMPSTGQVGYVPSEYVQC